MFRNMKWSLALGLISTLCSLPVSAREPREEGSTPFVAISKMPAPQVQKRLDRLFYRWETYELDLPDLERQVRATGRVTLHAGGRVFDMKLELNNLRALGFKQIRQTRRGPVEETPSPVATFKGYLVGEPESMVRLLIQPDFLQGYIRTADEWIFIDPLRKYAKSSAPSEIVLFDDDDVRPEAAALCGAGDLTRRAHDLMESQGSSGLTNATAEAVIPAPTLGRTDIATEADYEYYLIYGASTYSQIEGILNSVDGIYKADLALTLRIVYQSVWTTNQAPYPYTSTIHSTLLDQFKNYWNNNRANVARDQAHLFTGKQIVDEYGNVKDGVAFPGAVCRDSSLSYSLSR
ncbi:MAG TPA: zinc-dependent metalloprotease family protein, partial [Thermoanaerobaculia bacterium]|nr:zinc-dependent metalloprotease family protein [Thermoanaerobaculia bacterium]